MGNKKHYHVMGGLFGCLPNFNNYAESKENATGQLKEYAEIATDAEAFPTSNKDYIETRDEINSGGEQYTQKELEMEG